MQAACRRWFRRICENAACQFDKNLTERPVLPERIEKFRWYRTCGSLYRGRQMIYSRSTQYAIRALTFLAAKSPTSYWHLETIAEAEQIPRHFLAKLMQRLNRRRIVVSSKGFKGGLALGRPADSISLYSVADAIDDLAVTLRECVFRELECSDVHNCPLHESWKKLREDQVQFLQTTFISDLVNARNGS